MNLLLIALLASLVVITILAGVISFYLTGKNVIVGSNTDGNNIVPTSGNQTCTYDQLKTEEVKVTGAGSDNPLNRTYTGKLVSIVAKISNSCLASSYPFTELIEVRNSAGETVFMASQNTTVSTNKQLIISTSWTPEKPGDYTIRAATLHCPQCLSYPPISNYAITVLDKT